VVVSPEEVAAEDYATLTISVPTEKEVPTTKVRVEVPDGFVLSGVQPVPGWDSSFEEDGGLITAVTWSGGEFRPREFQQFLVQAQAPKSRASTLGRLSRPTRTAAWSSGPVPRCRGTGFCSRGRLRRLRGTRFRVGRGQLPR
jgi:hypothetical protein